MQGSKYFVIKRILSQCCSVRKIVDKVFDFKEFRKLFPSHHFLQDTFLGEIRRFLKFITPVICLPVLFTLRRTLSRSEFYARHS